jgi:hypothetical protein
MGGAVSASDLWPDLASLGFGLLAAALSAWYVAAGQWERQRRYTDKWRTGIGYSGGLHSGQPVGPSDLDHLLAELAAPQTGEAEEPTGAEEILIASPGPVGPVANGLIDAGTNLVSGTHRATGDHRWIQLAATACVVLPLTCLALALSIPLLLMMALTYMSDSTHDFRLRIIVALFLADIALQGITHL